MANISSLLAQDPGEDGSARLCPSARCRPGNLLLGVVQAEGSIDLLPEPLEVTEEFVTIAHQGRQPESRFRFAGLCHKRACYKWTDAGCGVAQTLRENMYRLDPAETIPECSIRPHCRWHHEHGPGICRGCRWVVTERSEMPARDLEPESANDSR